MYYKSICAYIWSLLNLSLYLNIFKRHFFFSVTNTSQLLSSKKKISTSAQEVPLEQSNILLPVKPKIQCQQAKKAPLHNLTYGKVLLVLFCFLVCYLNAF